MNLESIIKEEFSRFHWDEQYVVDSELDHLAWVSFPKCLILFSYDSIYGSLECEFAESFDDANRHYLLELLKFVYEYPLNDFDNLDLYKLAPSEKKLRSYAKAYVDIIDLRFRAVLLGDFSWKKKVGEFRKNTRIIQEALDTVFVHDHPIYRKMESGDPGWLADLKLLKNNSR